MKRKIVSAVIGVAVIVGGISFYAGAKYGEGKMSVGGSGNFANMSQADRQALRSQNGGTGGGRGGARQNGGFSSGEILSKDDPAPEQARNGASKSITIKLRDGGSKIVFLSGSTEVTKSVKGAAEDLTVGEQITVAGTPNADGSMNGQTIQIRPATPSGTPNNGR